MTILHVLIGNLLLPALVSATTIGLTRRMGRSPSTGRRGRWGVSVGLGLGYLAGHVGLFGWPSVVSFDPDGNQRVAWLVVFALILGVVEVTWSLPAWSTWIIRGLCVGGAVGTFLRWKDLNGWTVRESFAWSVGFWVVGLLSWWNLEAQAKRLSGPGWVVPMGLVAAGWATVQYLGQAPALAQLDGVLVSALVGALVTVGFRPGLSLSKGGPVVALTVLGGLALTGYLKFAVSMPAGLILLVAPWAPWVDRIGWIRRRSYWTRASVRFLAVLLTVGVAVFVADAGNSLRVEEDSAP